MKFYAPFPPPNKDTNPFQVLLAKELEELNWNIQAFNLKFLNLIKYRKKVSVLYFHWPEFIWRSDILLFSYLKALVFILKIYFAKLLKYKLVWSAHNVIPHEYKAYYLEKKMRIYILKNFDLIIGHSFNTEQELIEAYNFTGKKFVTAIHGHYEDLYQPEKKITRENLHIENNKVILFIKGSGKAYQGDEEFINTFIASKTDKIILVVSGRIKSALKEKIKHEKNILFFDKQPNHAELADLIEMSDFYVLPYKKITTSGAFFLALTFTKPIIAPDLSFFRLHTLPGTAILYNHKKPDIGEVLKTIENGFKTDLTALNKLKSEFSWEKAAQKISRELNSL